MSAAFSRALETDSSNAPRTASERPHELYFESLQQLPSFSLRLSRSTFRSLPSFLPHLLQVRCFICSRREAKTDLGRL